MSFETQRNQTFGGISRNFCRDIPGGARKFEKNRFVFNSRPLCDAIFFGQGIPPKKARNELLSHHLSGPLHRLNALLYLLHPLNCSRTPSAIGSQIGRPSLALSCIQTPSGALNRLLLNHLGSSTAQLWCYSV